MGILIKRDGSQSIVYPANGHIFSQEEIEMYGDLKPNDPEHEIIVEQIRALSGEYHDLIETSGMHKKSK
jgi:hypothetical protein